MLTLILLVVFGGGGGLLAIWLIDPDSLTPLTERLRLASLRGDRGQGTTGEGPAAPSGEAVPVAEPAPEPEPEPEPGPEPRREPVMAAAAPAAAGAPPGDLVRTPTAGPPRGRRSPKVPAAFTAIEGTYREVVRVPLWRKVLSLVLILLVLVAAGIAFAALLAGGLAVAAGLLDRAIG